MSSMLQYFFDIFVPSYESSSDMVDISDLIEQGKYCSPVELHYSDKNASLKNLGSAILMNICTSYRQTKLFPKRGIEILTSIIGKSMNSPGTAAKQIFLVHISKKNMDIDLFEYLIIKTDTMSVRSVLSEGEMKWVELARKVTTRRSNDVNVLQLVTKMDIISITIHGLAHLKIRKCIGDFNIHTAVLAATGGIDVNEFGVYVERRIFSKQVDWFWSTETVDIGYVEGFINAIENQSQLPAGFIKGALPRLGMPGVGGADLQLNSYLC